MNNKLGQNRQYKYWKVKTVTVFFLNKTFIK